MQRMISSSLMRQQARVLLLMLAMLLVGGALSPVHETRAQASDAVVWDQYDVTLDVRSDGTMQVTEHQVISFTGQFSSGFVYIPLSNVESIEDVTISVANSPSETPRELDYVRASRYDADEGTYTYQNESGELALDYAFEPTSWSATETRVVVLEYEVVGGLRVYEDLEPANQQVWWYAISRDVTDIAPIRESTVTINLPEDVSAEELVWFPDDPEPEITANSVSWHRTNLGEGDEFEVSLQFPPITDAEVPAWQAADDQLRQSRQEAQERSDWAGFLLLIAGLVASVGCGVGFLAIWFAIGRDPQVGLVAEYTESPPDDLNPGAVGVLLDEQFHPRDVVSTVLDLANRGVIRMEAGSTNEATPLTANPSTFTLLEHTEQLRDYEQIVLDVIFGPGAKPGQKTEMPSLAGALSSRNSEIASAFYQRLTEAGYFKESPEKTRKRWRTIFKATPFLIGAIVILIVFLAGAWSNFAFFPIAIGIVIMIFSERLARAMPRKTVAGAEAAAKWRAFANYLKDLEKRKDDPEALAIFNRYIPHAVALGLAEGWVSRYTYVPAPSFSTSFGGGTVIIADGRRRRGGQYHGGNWTQVPGQPSFPGSGGSGSGSGGFDMPTLQEASDSAAGGLQSGSNSFFDMLGTVAKAFAESSGGGSGSFGSFGGSGRGFSGGGSRGGGGGGGGGRRGFR
jgi:hypothetical protein